jgi:hypothetical protein
VNLIREPWETPVPYTRNWELTEDQLRDQIVKLRALIANDDTADMIKSAAERRLTRFEAQAEKRAVALPA